MSKSRRIRLRREGCYYLCVLAFIIGGAALRQVNLLVVLAGLMAGPLMFNWRLVVATIRGLSVRRRLPRRISAGDLLLVDLTVTNSRRLLDSWALMVEDVISLEGASGRANRTRVEVSFSLVPARNSARQSYRCQLSRRGKYQFGPLKTSSRFPLGLVQADMLEQATDTLVVCPRLGRLARSWSALVESQSAGSQRSQRQRGLVEGEFYGLRDWRPGDPRRWIHWRTTARRRQLTVRQFERQRNRDVALILDLWQPSAPTDEQFANVELAVSFAATAVADLCRRGGSHLLVSAVGQGRFQQAATASQVFMHDVLEQLAVVAGGSADQLGQALAHVLAGQSTGSRAVVISTRPRKTAGLDDASALRDNRRLAQAFGQVVWVDVSSAAVEEYFQLDPA